jgi:probable rRNA maturation factor
MSITIQVNRIPTCRDAKIPLNLNRLRKLISQVCRHFRVRRAVIEIEIVGDSEIRRMNRKYLKSSRITDCISFDLTEGSGATVRPRSFGSREQATKHYQIVVNAEKAAREAKKRRHRQEAELVLYVLHGLLHNLGFDDKRQTDANIMHKTEDSFLQQFDYGLVYNNR